MAMAASSVIGVSSSSDDCAGGRLAAVAPQPTVQDVLLPQSVAEVDLSALSQEQLQQWSVSIPNFTMYCSESCMVKLQNLRGFAKANPRAPLQKAYNAINALRARLLLFERIQGTSRWHADMQQQQQAPTNTGVAQTKQQLLQLLAAAQQLAAAADVQAAAAQARVVSAQAEANTAAAQAAAMRAQLQQLQQQLEAVV